MLLREGESAPLTLASHDGMAIVPQGDAPDLYKNVSYFLLGLGPSDLALKARKESILASMRKHTTVDCFLVADQPKGGQKEMAFDVALGQFEEGNQIVLVSDGQNTFGLHNPNRHFIINDNGTVSPSISPPFG